VIEDRVLIQKSSIIFKHELMSSDTQQCIYSSDNVRGWSMEATGPFWV